MATGNSILDEIAGEFREKVLNERALYYKLAKNEWYTKAYNRRIQFKYPFETNPIRWIRDQMGLRQEELASLLVISRAGLSRIEHKRNTDGTLFKDLFYLASRFELDISITNAPHIFPKIDMTPEERQDWEEHLSPAAKLDMGWSYFGEGEITYDKAGRPRIPEPRLIFASYEAYEDYLVRKPYLKGEDGRPGEFCNPEIGHHRYVPTNVIRIPFPNGTQGREYCLTCHIEQSRRNTVEELDRMRKRVEEKKLAHTTVIPENFFDD